VSAKSADKPAAISLRSFSSIPILIFIKSPVTLSL
jgi:hypothetical protein